MDAFIDTAKSSAKQAKRKLVGAPEDETPLEELNAMCTCSYRTRLIGFVSCLVVGLLLGFVSFFFFANVKLFATFYTLGNLTSLAGTGFVVGPMRQIKAMLKPTRYIAAIVFVASMIGTLCAVFVPATPNKVLVIVCVIIQFCALWWYSLSYIPFARKLVSSLLGRCFKA
jgi:F0F1-type ATP synthase assembly protein I